MAISPSLPAPEANLSIAASFSAGPLAAVIAAMARSASEPAGIGTDLPICWPQTGPAKMQPATTNTTRIRRHAGAHVDAATLQMDCGMGHLRFAPEWGATGQNAGILVLPRRGCKRNHGEHAPAPAARHAAGQLRAGGDADVLRGQRQCPFGEALRNNTCGRERPIPRCLRGFPFFAK